MKFATLALIAVVAAQDDAAAEESADQGACDFNDPNSCPPVDGKKQSCATMTVGDFSTDQCVQSILCNETIEQDG